MDTQDLRKMNMDAELLMPSGARRWPERVVANWRQFSSGLWRVPEDDISAAYSAETFHKIECSRTKADYSETTAGISPGRSLPGVDCYPTPFSLEPTHAVGIKLCIKLCIKIVESYWKIVTA
jgi:hypothetical protein